MIVFMMNDVLDKIASLHFFIVSKNPNTLAKMTWSNFSRHSKVSGELLCNFDSDSGSTYLCLSALDQQDDRSDQIAKFLAVPGTSKQALGRSRTAGRL